MDSKVVPVQICPAFLAGCTGALMQPQINIKHYVEVMHTKGGVGC